MASKIKESKSKKKRPRERQYQPMPQNFLSSREETAKAKLLNTREHSTLRPSEQNKLASEYTDAAKLREVFETPGGAGADVLQRTDKFPVKLYLARPQGVDRELTFTGSVARPDSIEVRFEQFCSYGVNSEAALQVGDQYFKWTQDNLVIPRGIKIRDDSHGAQPLSLGDEMPDDLGETGKLDQLLELVAEYNGTYYYHEISRNSKTFVRDALRRLDKPVHPLLQMFDNYHDRIKSLQSLGIKDGFRSHRELDEYYNRTDHATIVRNKRNVEYLFFLCVCFHVLGRVRDGNKGSRQWTCNERDCCLPYLLSNLTQDNLIFSDFWRLFKQ